MTAWLPASAMIHNLVLLYFSVFDPLRTRKKKFVINFFFKIGAVTQPLFQTNIFPDISDFWSVLGFPTKKPIKMLGHGAFTYDVHTDEKQKYFLA